jgi:N-glycosidase YbiA
MMSAEIIEHTRNDNYWGDGGDGGGRNMLGKTLMLVREELRKGEKE